MIKLKYIIFSLVLLTGTYSCEDEEYMRASYVNFYIYLNQAQYNDLHAVNNAMIIDDKVLYNGVNYAPNGVIIYRFSDAEFKAYDATCTHNHEERHPIEIFDSYKARCTVCGSEFELIYGTPIKGPASYSLLEYKTRIEGNALYVSN